MNKDTIKSVLILGISGGLAQMITSLLLEKYPLLRVVGIDSRKVDHSISHERLKVFQMNYTRSNIEKVFREYEFDIVYHLARVNHAQLLKNSTMAKRLDHNIVGTQRILNLSQLYKVKKIIVMSTYHVYGALSDNPTYIGEESLLRASINHPELRDVVEMDHLTTNWMWKNQQEIETIVFRPCPIIGPQLNNTITQYLKTPFVPVCADFNPMMQMIHHTDMARVCVAALETLPTGVYNVATNDIIGLKKAKEYLNQPVVPIPSLLLHASASLTKKILGGFPRYLVDYIQYACILDNSLLLKYLSQDFFHYTIEQSLESIRDQ